MRRKPIQRDEIRFNGNSITTLPLDSVRDAGGKLVPIERLWLPLLRQLHRERQAARDKREQWLRSLGGKPRPTEPPGPVYMPQPDIFDTPCHCTHCGRGFLRVTGSGRLFCSDVCKDAILSARQSRAVAEARALARAGRTCAVCGTALAAQRSTMRFCSPKCRKAEHRRTRQP